MGMGDWGPGPGFGGSGGWVRAQGLEWDPGFGPKSGDCGLGPGPGPRLGVRARGKGLGIGARGPGSGKQLHGSSLLAAMIWFKLCVSGCSVAAVWPSGLSYALSARWPRGLSYARLARFAPGGSGDPPLW